MDYTLINTSDGSHTLLLNGINETYHSKFGAISESKHIFIVSGFCYLATSKENLNILEVGFGTGLNAFLTLIENEQKKIKIHYTAYEPYPLDEKTVKSLNYPELVNMKNAGDLFARMHQQIHKETYVTENFKLCVIKRRIQDAILASESFDLVYYDAFAPQVQPEMWTSEIFGKIASSTKKGGVLVTYSSKGEVRRALQSVGFRVEKIPGPPGKREFIRAIKI